MLRMKNWQNSRKPLKILCGDVIMNKAILIIDMPESCDKCPLFHGFYTDMTCGANNYGIDYPYPKDFRQDWCPLKEVPDRKDVD